MIEIDKSEYEQKLLKHINKLGEMIEQLSDGQIKLESLPEKFLSDEEKAELEAKMKETEEEILRAKQLEEAQNDAINAVWNGLFMG